MSFEFELPSPSNLKPAREDTWRHLVDKYLNQYVYVYLLRSSVFCYAYHILLHVRFHCRLYASFVSILQPCGVHCVLEERRVIRAAFKCNTSQSIIDIQVRNITWKSRTGKFVQEISKSCFAPVAIILRCSAAS